MHLNCQVEFDSRSISAFYPNRKKLNNRLKRFDVEPSNARATNKDGFGGGRLNATRLLNDSQIIKIYAFIIPTNTLTYIRWNWLQSSIFLVVFFSFRLHILWKMRNFCMSRWWWYSQLSLAIVSSTEAPEYGNGEKENDDYFFLFCSRKLK